MLTPWWWWFSLILSFKFKFLTFPLSKVSVRQVDYKASQPDSPVFFPLRIKVEWSGQQTWQLAYFMLDMCIPLLIHCYADEPLQHVFSYERTKILVLRKGVRRMHLPKKSACNSRGRCSAQSSLTLWSTTISVIKITAMLHLKIITNKCSECTKRWSNIWASWEHPPVYKINHHNWF